MEESLDERQQQPKQDPRYYIADELRQTEKNYVSILTTIVKVSIIMPHMCTHIHMHVHTNVSPILFLFEKCMDIVQFLCWCLHCKLRVLS